MTNRLITGTVEVSLTFLLKDHPTYTFHKTSAAITAAETALGLLFSGTPDTAEVQGLSIQVPSASVSDNPAIRKE